MALIQTGDMLNRKVYQDDTNYHRTIEVRKQIQPIKRRVNGAQVTSHVVVTEIALRDLECTNIDACDPTKKTDTPVTIRVRASGPVGTVKLDELLALLNKAITGSGGVSKPVLTAVKSW